jgi:hypothetical protein
MKHKPSKYFDFHSWSEYYTQSGSIVEQSSTPTKEKKSPVEKIISDCQCCCCEGKKGENSTATTAGAKENAGIAISSVMEAKMAYAL